MTKFLSLASVIAIGASLCATPAFAQEPQGADEGTNVDEIVVSARKRTESLQSVPMSVAVITGDRLVEQNLGQIENLQSVTAGLVIRKTPNNLVNLTLRGLGTGTAIDSFEQSVASFLDGTYAGRGPEFNSALFDFQQVEIIRGAQASLLSKNTSLGAISLVTRKPGREFGYNVTATLDMALGSKTVEAGIDLPVSDNFQIRVAGKADDQHGYIYNTFFRNDVSRTRNVSGRITLAFQPTDNLDITLMYQHFRVRQTGIPWEIYNDPSGNLEALSAFAGFPGLEIGANRRQSEGSALGQSYDRTHGNRVIGTINYTLGSGHTITSVSSYSDFDSDRWRDTDLLPGDYLNGLYLQSNNQLQQELRIASPADGQLIDYVVGATYFRENWFFSDRVVSQCIGCPAALTTGAGRFTLRGSWVSRDDQKTTDLAGFAQVNVNFNSALTLSGGVRYTNTDRQATMQRDILVAGPATSVLYQGYAPVTLRRKEDNIDGSVSLKWNATSNLMLYGSYSKGTKSGGFNNSTTTAGTPAGAAATEYGNETAHTIEVGEKLTLGRGGFFNVAVFQTDIDGFQQATFNGSNFVITGENLRSRGVEVEATVPLMAGFRLQSQLTYADTFRKATGLKPPGAPEWTGNVNLNMQEQKITNGLSLTGDLGVEFRSGIFLTNEENTIGFPGRPANVVPDSPGYAYLNARIGLKSTDGWDLALIGRNLTDKTVIEYSVPISLVGNGSYVTLNRPRTVSLQLTLRH